MCEHIIPDWAAESTMWLEQYLSQKKGVLIQVSDPQYKIVSNFSLIWNLYETIIAQKGRVGLSVSEEPSKSDLHPRLIDESYSFFRGRYVDQKTNKLNEYYEGLMRYYRKKGKKGKRGIEQSLLSSCNIVEKHNMCLSIIIICRDNLFHGHKDLMQIWSQRDLFITINRYLAACIDAYQNYSDVNKP